MRRVVVAALGSTVLAAVLVAHAPVAAAVAVVPSSIGSPLPGGGASGAVAISGDLAVQGNYPYTSPTQTASVQVFQNSGSGWSLAATLTPPAGDALPQLFGGSVAVETCAGCAPTVAVGSSSEIDVYISTATGWSLQQEIPQPSDALNHFGGLPGELALSGDTLAVGDGGYSRSAGSVWIYARNNGVWTEGTQLTGSIPGECDFGRWVDVKGEELVVGAPGEQTSGCGDTGDAHIYTGGASDWSQQAVLTDQPTTTINGQSNGAGRGDVVPDAAFGSSVAIDGATAVVGEPGGNCGQAVVFQRASDNTWRRGTTLLNPSGSCSFGTTVALDAGRVVVGSPDNAPSAVFQSSTPGGWSPVEELQPPAGCGASSGQCSFQQDAGISGTTEILNGSVSNAYVYP